MPRRPGYSLVELLVVMAALVVLGGVLVPTLTGVARDTRVKAGADLLRQRVADARAHAIGEARAYKLAVATDGTRVRVAPDDQSFAAMAATDADADGHYVVEDSLPPEVQFRPSAEPASTQGMQGMTDDAGWTRVATFLPDGTCREDDADIDVQEPSCYTLRVHIRGLTGAATVCAFDRQGDTVRG